MIGSRLSSVVGRAAFSFTASIVACAPQATAPAGPAAKPDASQPSASSKAAPASGAGIALGSQLAGDESTAKDREGSGGTLTIAMSAGNVPYPNTPPNEGFEGRRFVGYQIYDAILNFTLDQPDSVPAPGPGLAERWSIGDDKLTWTFTLRKGVKFHDGSELTVDAVIFNLDRMLEKEGFEYYDPDISVANRTNLSVVDSYGAVDGSSFWIKTNVPYSILPWEMGFITIASPTAIKHG